MAIKVSNDTKKKTAIYGGNFLTPSAISFFRSFPEIAKSIKNIPALDKILDGGVSNPLGAAFFGVLSIFKV